MVSAALAVTACSLPAQGVESAPAQGTETTTVVVSSPTVTAPTGTVSPTPAKVTASADPASLPKTTTVVGTAGTERAPAAKRKATAPDLVTVPTDKHGRVKFDEDTGATLARIPVTYFKDLAQDRDTTPGFEQDIAGCYIAYPLDGPRWSKASKATRAVLMEGLSDCLNATIGYHKMYE